MERNKLYQKKEFFDYREMLHYAAETYNNKIAFRLKKNGNYQDISYIDFKRDIIDIVVRIIIGVFLIGPMGVLSGFIANKNFISYRLISIEFKNGNKSLVKIDNRTFKYFVQKVY